MKRWEFFDMIEGLYGWFRYQTRPTRRTIDDWHTEVKYIDSAALTFIQADLKNRERLPPNIPLAIKGIYAEWKKRNLCQAEIKYNEIEDPRYPVENLQVAYETYKKRGAAEMIKFCKATGMPKNDVDRVINACVKSAKEQREKADRLFDGLADMEKIECHNVIGRTITKN